MDFLLDRQGHRHHGNFGVKVYCFHAMGQIAFARITLAQSPLGTRFLPIFFILKKIPPGARFSWGRA